MSPEHSVLHKFRFVIILRGWQPISYRFEIVLFYRVGGNTRLSGFMLAAATAAMMVIGPQIIGLLPVMVVGELELQDNCLLRQLIGWVCRHSYLFARNRLDEGGLGRYRRKS